LRRSSPGIRRRLLALGCRQPWKGGAAGGVVQP